MGKRTLKPAAPATELDDDLDLDVDLEEEELPASHDEDGDDDLWDDEDGDDDLWDDEDGDDDLWDDEDGDEPTDLEGRLDQALGSGALTDDERAITACKYCGCTEATACETPDGPCSWIRGDVPVCTNLACLQKYLFDGGVLSAELLEYLVANAPTPAAEETDPPIAEREEAAPADLGDIAPLAIVSIEPDPDQPRLDVDDELAGSIAAQGILQPIVVRTNPTTPSRYIIVDGERRYRGALKAGFAFVPARIVHDVDDIGNRLLLQVTLNEGKRLAPMEEAKAWKRIMDAKGWKIQQLASALGRAKSTVSDRLAMLDAPAAFQELLINGTLTAAAAPIVREYRHLPERALKELVKAASNDWGWRKHIEGGGSIPVANVKETLSRVVLYTFPSVSGDVEFGDVFELKGVRYAIDRDAYHQAAAAARRAAEEANGGKPRAETGNAASRRIQDEERKRRERAAKTRQLRRAQFHAIADRVPATLDGKWSLLLVRYAIKEMQQLDQSIAAKALGIPMTERAGHVGHAAEKALVAHAEKLSTAARLNFLMKLLLATDLQVSEWNGGGSAERLSAAAKLARVDLKKVRAPDPAKPAKPIAPKRIPGKPDFIQPQQPDAALAAIVGDKAQPRTEITKKLWAYIKKHGLQDTRERRMINCDDKLRCVMGTKKQVSMFEMTKLVNKHLTGPMYAKTSAAKKGGRR